MKLLTQVGDKAQLDGLTLLFESKGIPVFVGNEAAARNMGFLSPGRQHALWVVFDEQYDDALALLADPEHEVENPVDVEEYRRRLEDAEAGARNRIFGMVMLGGVVVVLLAAALLFALSSFSVAL
jgi:hypothetical protein